jgi:DNA ligase-1
MAEGDVHLEGVWISEPKLDDERIITLCKGDQIDLWTRRYVEVSYELP